MYEKFLDWIHTDRPEDLPIIVGGEVFILSIVLLWKFYDSSLSDILRIENNILFLFINAGLIVLLITGLVLLIVGIRIKLNNRK